MLRSAQVCKEPERDGLGWLQRKWSILQSETLQTALNLPDRILYDCVFNR